MRRGARPTDCFRDLTVDGRLLVFAHEAEAQSFADVPHLVTGIGKVSAATGLATHLARHSISPGFAPIKEIVVLGTAGVINDSFSLTTVYRVSRAIQHDLAFAAPVADLHADGTVALSGGKTGDSAAVSTAAVSPAAVSTAADDFATAHFETAIISTGDAFVTDDAVRASLASQGAALVDMESYAYARVCAELGVPLKIFKVGSDYADSQTTDETWDQIVARKSTQLFDFARGSHFV